MSIHQIVETYFIPIQLALAMLGMGATLSVRDFSNIARDPRGLGIGLVAQWVLVPLFAVAIVFLFDLSPGWAVGLILVSAVPGGAFSNLLTFFGRGSVALSISLTVAATALCVVTVPLILRLLAGDHLPSTFVFPTNRVVLEISAYLIAPLLAGMVLFRVQPVFAEKVSKWAIRGAMLFIVLITMSALQSGRIKVLDYGWKPPLIIILFGVALANLIPHITRVLGRYDDDTVAIGIEVTVRNVGVGLLMVPFFFADQPEYQGHVLYTCLFYAGASGAFALPMMFQHRFGKSVVPLRSAYRRPEPAEAVPG